MLKIGEFSTLTRISIRTLRHYDELGLLRPVHVDAETGYRYYSVTQLPRLHRILALRDLGFPLERIAGALDEGITADALRGMLLLRRAEQEEQVQEETERLNRLTALLHLIEQEGRMRNDVIVKDVGPQWIASVRETIPAYRAIGELFIKLTNTLIPLGIDGARVAFFHDKEYREKDVDMEAGLMLKQSAEVPAPMKCYQLPAASVACIVHHGAFNRVGEAYGALLRWIDANNFRPAGPPREIFLHVSVPASRDDESNVTEIQVPVEKS